MNFVEIEGVLAAQPEKLMHPRLNALQADDTLYTLLALQPEGRIRVTETAIGHADKAAAEAQFRSFFSLIADLDRQPDIAICPEYSVPWAVLLDVIESGAGPQPGKLWVLGCESLPLGQLQTYRERLRGKAIIIDDETSSVPLTTQKYRNPLVYVFRTQSIDASEHLVMLVQYKTEPSGDAENTEARGMLPGQSVYIFGRSPKEVRLITLICSDVFGLTEAQICSHYDGLLMLHIQLNNNPRHTLYRPYRQKLFSYGGRTELVCLNWAENINVIGDDGITHEWHNIGGSAWYLLPPDFDTSDARIAENHLQGIYYTRHEPIRAHALQFHYGPRIFVLEATKVYHHGVIKPRSNLSGPKAICTYQWSAQNGNWSAATAPNMVPEDGFDALLGRVSAGANLEDLTDIYRTGPVGVERVLAISAGEFGPMDNWYEAPQVDSMRLSQEEIVRRVTVALDPDGAPFRSSRLGAARTLAALRAAGHTWPSEVEFLNNGFRLQWSQTFPHRNIEATDGTLATVVYAGQLGDPAYLERLDQKARKTVAGPVPEPSHPLSADGWRAHRLRHYSKAPRLCILYNDGASVKVYRNPMSDSISAPAGSSPVDITTPAPRRAAGGSTDSHQ